MSSDKDKIVEGFQAAGEDNDSLEKVVARESGNVQHSQEELFKQNIQTEKEQPATYEGEELNEIDSDHKSTIDEVEQFSVSQSEETINTSDQSRPEYIEESLELDSETSSKTIPQNNQSDFAGAAAPTGSNANGLSDTEDQTNQQQALDNIFLDNAVSDQEDNNFLEQDEALNQPPVAKATTSTTDEDNMFFGQLSADDPDQSDVLNYTLVEDVAEGEVIVNPDGSFKFIPNDDFQDLADGESREVTFTFQVQDIFGSVSSAVKTIIVTGNNDAPDGIELSNLSISENSPGSTAGTLSASDIDNTDTHTYSVSDERFEIVKDADGNMQLKLKDDVSLNHENDDIINVAVTATDSGGLSTTQQFSLNILDINEAPTNISLDAFDTVASTQQYGLGDTGNGIVGQDGATGAGYIMYSDESVHARFGDVHATSADNFIAVKHIDGKWYYDTNTSYVEFVPEATDRLIAEVDFGADEVNLLSGINDSTYQIEGINAGYESGDLQITPNIWNGNANNGEFGISGSSFSAAIGEDIASVDENAAGSIIGNLSVDDVDVGDTATYLVNDERFEVVEAASGNMQLKLRDGVSLDHEFNDTIDLTITAIDSGGLATTQDFSINVANVNEMPVLEMLSGNQVSENSSNQSHNIDIGDTGYGIVGQDGATGTGYIMYSDESVHARFGNVHATSADNFIAVKHIDGKWYYDTNTSYVEFVPEATDRLIAEVDFGADEVNLLSGINDPTYQIEGINAGYESGDLQITPNSWSEEQHAFGEFGISGTQISFSSPLVVGTVTASDVDGDSLTYSLLDDSEGRFGINPQTGEVYVTDSSKIDFESNSEHQITVQVADGNGGIDTETYTINVIDTDEFSISAVTDSNVAANEIIESASVGSFVGITAFAIDESASNNDVTYSLSSNPGNAFSIDADTGEVTVNDPSALDFENDASMQIEVTATSEDGSTSSETFSIAINDANEFAVSAVTDSDNATNEVLESAVAGTSVGVTAFASDDDGTTSDVTYSLSSNPGDAFSIHPDSGEVTVNDPSALDFESASSMQIEVTATSEDGSTSSETFTIAINDANEFAISAVTDSDNTTNEVSELAEKGASVGITAFASDADGTTNDITYSLTSNPDNAFSIDADTGEVTVNDPGALDFENSASMQIEVTATSEDGSASSETFTIAINDANEFVVSAVTDSDNAANEVSEIATAGTSVGVTAFASDADGTTNDVTYSLSSNPGNAFAIDANTGEVTVNDPSALDFENSASMQIEVTATSEDDSTSAETFTIAINDANEFAVSAVTDFDNAANEVSESAVAGTSVGVTAFASDADGTTNDVTYSLSDNPGNAFAIDAEAGEVTVNDPGALDFESNASMQIEVTATSEDGSTSAETFTIAINDVNEFDISAVTDVDKASNEVSESAEKGASVGITAFASDADGSTNDVTYSLSEDANGAFTIDANTGEVYVSDPSQLDFEKDSAVKIEVTATSEDGSVSTEVFKIAINDANEFDISAVTDVDKASNEVSETAEKGASVGITAFASDADGSTNDVTYSLSEDANGSFAIDANTGEVYVSDPSQLDFEKDSAVKIEVTATSEDGSVSTEVFKIAINDANEFVVSAVMDSDKSTNEVSESASVGTSVGITAFASDADGTTNDVTYSLSSNPGDAFSIDADTGEVTVNDPSAIDFENNASMQIEVTATSEDGSTSSETFSIAINDANEFAVSTVTDSDATSNEVSESAIAGTSVGITAFASDADGTTNDVTYSLTSNPGNAFAINAESGEVSVNDPSALDFENVSSMQIEVTATSEDGSTSSETFSIAINDANEFAVSAVTDSDNAANEVSESAVAGTSVGITAFASDADGTTNDVTYSLSSNPGDAFSIDADTGEVTVNDPSALDFENDASMQIEVTATSEDGSTSSETFSIAINDANEFAVSAVTDSDNATNEVLESAVAGTSVGVTAFASDDDGTTSDVTYSLSSNSGDAFSIDPDSGEVTVNDPSALDFESASSMQIEVTATSEDGSISSETFNIAINDANEFAVSAITDSDNTTNEVSESAAVGTSVGITAFASDTDGTSNDVTYSLSSNPGNAFSIDADTGEVTVNDPSALDFENNASMQIEVTATSEDGSTSVEKFTIAVNDANEFSVSAITDVDKTSNEVSESAEKGTSVGITAFASDVDGSNNVVKYSLENSHGDAFAIDPETGEVTVNDPSQLNFENDSTMQIKVTATSEDGSTSVEKFTIAVNDANEFSVSAVTDVDKTSNEVSESAEKGASVGITAFASDADGTTSDVTYSLSEDANGSFAIDANTGEVYVSDPSQLDFEKDSAVKIEVTATSEDGSVSTEVFKIAINDANEFDISAVTDVDKDSNEVSEAAEKGTSVGVTAFASDADGTTSDVTYSLSSNAGNAFSIDADTGEVTVNDPSALDFENASSMQIEVTAASEDGSTSSETFSISINDANEFDISAVTDMNKDSNEVSEAAEKGTSVGITAFASDADGSTNDVTYSLSSNPGNAFAIDADTGEVTVNDPSALDFENASNMQIEVTATSEDGSVSTEMFNIAVNDINEGANIITSNVTGDEDTAVALNIQLTNVEPGADVVVTIDGVPNGAVLSAGTDNGDGSWTLDQSDITGLTITPPEDSSTDFSLSIQTNVTENGSSLSYNNTIDVDLNAVADAPVIIGPDSITHLQNQEINFEGGLGVVDTLGSVSNPNSFGGQAPTEGSQVAQLLSQGAADSQIEAELGLASGTLDTLSPGNATDGSSMQTAIAVEEGDVITFDWNFVNAETVSDTASGFNDFAIVNINGNPQELARSSDVNGPGPTGWQTFSFTVAESGVLDLGFAMINTNDRQVDSSLLIDNIEVNDETVDVRPVELNLNIALADNDGSETLDIQISGVPEDAALSGGVNLGGGVWSLTAEEVADVQLVPSATSSGTVSLTITATATEADGGDTSTSTHTIDVAFETLDTAQLGTAGADTLNGDADNNIIAGKDGDDVISGNDGHDYISGGDGNDTINGDAGDDQLFGDAGDDELNGGSGNDTLTGGTGNDALAGGDGNDIFIFAEGSGDDTVQGGSGWEDVIQLQHDVSAAVDPDSPWQIEVNGEQVAYDVEAGILEFESDTSGVITFDDGSEITFDGIENIQW